jgi:hypothetical protein
MYSLLLISLARPTAHNISQNKSSIHTHISRKGERKNTEQYIMFCCFDCGGQGGSPSYPGQRSVPSGFYSSGGNALTNQPNYNQQQQPHNRDEESVCGTSCLQICQLDVLI